MTVMSLTAYDCNDGNDAFRLDRKPPAAEDDSAPSWSALVYLQLISN